MNLNSLYSLTALLRDRISSDGLYAIEQIFSGPGNELTFAEDPQDDADAVMDILQREKVGPDTMEQAEQILAGEDIAEDEPFDVHLPGSPKPGGGRYPQTGHPVSLKGKVAMDMTTKIVRAMNAAVAAKAEVEAAIGHPILAQDSAESTYRQGLIELDHDVRGVDSSAMRAMFKLARANGARPRVAMDQKSAAAFAERYPAIANLRCL